MDAISGGPAHLLPLPVDHTKTETLWLESADGIKGIGIPAQGLFGSELPDIPEMLLIQKLLMSLLRARLHALKGIAAFVDQHMVAGTQRHPIFHTGRAAIGPVMQVMDMQMSCLGASRPDTVRVALAYRPGHGIRPDSRFSPDVHRLALLRLYHGSTAIAGNPPCGFAGNRSCTRQLGALLRHGEGILGRFAMGCRSRFGQFCRIDRDDDLIAIRRSDRLPRMLQAGLCHLHSGIGALPGNRAFRIGRCVGLRHEALDTIQKSLGGFRGQGQLNAGAAIVGFMPGQGAGVPLLH